MDRLVGDPEGLDILWKDSMWQHTASGSLVFRKFQHLGINNVFVFENTEIITDYLGYARSLTAGSSERWPRIRESQG